MIDDLIKQGQEARDWLRTEHHFVNSKWKNVRLEWFGEARFQGREEDGSLAEYKSPPGYVLTYNNSLFRFMERVEVRFSESDILSTNFCRSETMAIWDAHYSLRIDLSDGVIELIYRPPFYGVRPIANARHSEEVRVSYNLHYSSTG